MAGNCCGNGWSFFCVVKITVSILLKITFCTSQGVQQKFIGAVGEFVTFVIKFIQDVLYQ